jgi:uncharacterized repeat protein (TIGR03803 family)
VFKVNKDGTGHRVLYSFGGTPMDGQNPQPGLLQASDGALYGTTLWGGSLSWGTAFKLSNDGRGYAALHSFGSAFHDGAAPNSMIEGKDGELYGTTRSGGEGVSIGSARGSGTIFRLNKDGTGYTVLKWFSGNTWSEPSGPIGALVEGNDGLLYGVTEGGGADDEGTVFRIDKLGNHFAVLYSLRQSDGNQPQAGPVQGKDGAFYGTTANGGAFNLGTVFKIWPPEAPAMLNVLTAGNTNQVTFSGLSGARYQVLRLTNLMTWTSSPAIVMPPSGSYTDIDAAVQGPWTFYRAVWLP